MIRKIDHIIPSFWRVLLLNSIIITALLSCTPSKECPYIFKIPALINPNVDEFKVGDTISFVSRFHKRIPGFNTEGKEVGIFDLSNLDWLPVFFIYRIDTILEEKPSVLLECFDFLEDPKFDFYVKQYSDQSTGLLGAYNFESDSFLLIFKIIPKKPGTFMSEFGCYPGNLNEASFEGSCAGEYHVWTVMNGNGENNSFLLYESPDSYYNTWVTGNLENNFNNVGGFCFRVLP